MNNYGIYRICILFTRQEEGKGTTKEEETKIPEKDFAETDVVSLGFKISNPKCQ